MTRKNADNQPTELIAALAFLNPNIEYEDIMNIRYPVKNLIILKDEFDIYLVEWVDCTGGKLVVQRNKIKDLLPESKFYTLYEDKTELFSIKYSQR